MKVEIWSDVVCPFCYIGKRRFENALANFQHAAKVNIEWKSFELSPNSVTDPTININQFLAQHKGISVDEARRMNNHVTVMASGVGLTYNFDEAIVANTFNAHRMLHLSKQFALQREMKERLFAAYFTEGRNIDDQLTLQEIGVGIGLEAVQLRQTLSSEDFTEDVIGDIMEAQQLGIRGVPFFVFDRKYAISGAQVEEAFSQTLEQSFDEWVDA